MVQKHMPVVRTSPVVPPEARPDWATLVPLPTSRVSSRRPIIVGHRGAAGLAPENTLAAFQVAADLGIDGVEFDVQRTKDGHVIVFHDENVKRVTGVDARVEHLTLEEIKALDVGRSFGPEFEGERIPTLSEAFDFLRSQALLLFIELKDPWMYPGIESAIVALIREYDLAEQLCVRAFYHDALHTIHRLAPEIPLSELWLDRLPTDDEIVFKTIAHIHQRGQQVTAWTVDDLEDARRLMAAGVDGLTTNTPDRLLTLFE
jgi:glycerophosphoryl diester phosphodiesterase